MPAVDEEKLQEAFLRAVNRLITDKETFISCMVENIEKVIYEQASAVDLVALDRKLESLRGEMSTLVKPEIGTDIYGEEYNRIAGEMEDLRNRRAGVTQAE